MSLSGTDNSWGHRMRPTKKFANANLVEINTGAQHPFISMRPAQILFVVLADYMESPFSEAVMKHQQESAFIVIPCLGSAAGFSALFKYHSIF